MKTSSDHHTIDLVSSSSDGERRDSGVRQPTGLLHPSSSQSSSRNTKDRPQSLKNISAEAITERAKAYRKGKRGSRRAEAVLVVVGAFLFTLFVFTNC